MKSRTTGRTGEPGGCGHKVEGTRACCPHVWAAYEQEMAAGSGDLSYHLHFTGQGRSFGLSCAACLDEDSPWLPTCDACADALQEKAGVFACEGLTGRPEILELPSAVGFERERVVLPGISAADILDIQPIAGSAENLWMALLRSGRLARLDLARGKVTTLCEVPREAVPEGAVTPWAPRDERKGLESAWPRWQLLQPGPEGDLALVGARRGQRLWLVDVATGAVRRTLDRGAYQVDASDFPVAFARFEGRLVLVHAGDWNWLDVTDCATGECLTERRRARDGEHHREYFHGQLLVSPGGEWVADNGWMWHPIGMVSSWSLRQWMAANPWESDDGESLRILCQRLYYWQGDMCWVGPDTLAVYGFGSDDDWIVPAVLLFDVATGRRLKWFPGPRGWLAFDGCLVSSDQQDGTSVWDLETGARRVHVPDLAWSRYHPGAGAFLGILPDGSLEVSRRLEVVSPP